MRRLLSTIALCGVLFSSWEYTWVPTADRHIYTRSGWEDTGVRQGGVSAIRLWVSPTMFPPHRPHQHYRYENLHQIYQYRGWQYDGSIVWPMELE